MTETENDSQVLLEEDILEIELKLAAKRFVDYFGDGDWAHQPRVVYDGETIERELDELFPVEVGLQALRELKEKREQNSQP